MAGPWFSGSLYVESWCRKQLQGRWPNRAGRCPVCNHRAGLERTAQRQGDGRGWLTAKFVRTERAHNFHTSFAIKTRRWREWGGKQGLNPCQCGLEGCVTSELPGKQSTAKLRTFPEAAEFAYVRDHCQRRSAEICSVNALAGLLQSEGQALFRDNSAVWRAQHPRGMVESNAKFPLVLLE